MRWQPVPIVGGAYADENRHWSVQDTVNYLPVRAERAGTRSTEKLVDVPGMEIFAQVGTGPVRGMHNAEGKLFVVSGTTLYQVHPDETSTAIGTIPGVGRCQMAHNQITGGNELIVVNGLSGYTYNTYTGTFAQITDDAYPGAIAVTYFGQYLIQVEPGRRYWFHSDLASARAYDAIDRYEAESSPDRILSVIASQGQVLVFGERTCEVWANEVDGTAAFQRAGITIEKGIASPHAVVSIDNSVMFLGNDGIVYRLDGYRPVPVSTGPMHKEFLNHDLKRAFMFVWEDAGHKVAYLTFPSGHTWGFDVTQGEWHRRQSYGLNRWRLNTLVHWNGKWIGGDAYDNTLWRLDWDVQREGCDELERIRTTGVLHNHQNRIQLNAIEIVMEVGKKPNPCTPYVPPLVLTGDLPDGNIGTVVDTYFVASGGTPPYGDITVVSGTVPPGVTIAADGHATGAYTAAGIFTFRLRVIDSVGEIAYLDVDVEVGAWIMVSRAVGAGSVYDRMYFAATPLGPWGNFRVRTSPIGGPTSGSAGAAEYFGSENILILGSAGERIEGIPATGNIPTTAVTIPTDGNGNNVAIFAVSGGVGGGAGFSTVNGGVTFVGVGNPQPTEFNVALARKGDTWYLAKRASGAPSNIYRSVVPQPTSAADWALWTPAVGGSDTRMMLASPTALLVFGANGNIGWSDGNISFTSRTKTGTGGFDQEAGYYANSTFMVADTAGLIHRSTDDGQSWQNVYTMAAAPHRVYYADGYWCVSTAQHLYVSADNGSSWTSVAIPYDVNGIDNRAPIVLLYRP